MFGFCCSASLFSVLRSRVDPLIQTCIVSYVVYLDSATRLAVPMKPKEKKQNRPFVGGIGRGPEKEAMFWGWGSYKMFFLIVPMVVLIRNHLLNNKKLKDLIGSRFAVGVCSNACAHLAEGFLPSLGWSMMLLWIFMSTAALVMGNLCLGLVLIPASPCCLGCSPLVLTVLSRGLRVPHPPPPPPPPPPLESLLRTASIRRNIPSCCFVVNARATSTKASALHPRLSAKFRRSRLDLEPLRYSLSGALYTF